MKKAKVVKMNLRTRCEVYEVAEKMLGELKPYVSNKLLAEIKERLMGFSPEMQVELADRVMDFYFTETICPTECISADNALVACCIRITAEKILEDWEIKNTADDFGHMWQKFSKEAAKAVKENFWNPWFNNSNDSDLSKEYLKAWLERKYWNK